MQLTTVESAQLVPLEDFDPFAAILVKYDQKEIDEFEAIALSEQLVEPRQGRLPTVFNATKAALAITEVKKAIGNGIPVSQTSLAQKIGVNRQTFNTWMQVDDESLEPRIRLFGGIITRLMGASKLSTMEVALMSEKAQPRDRLQALAMVDPHGYSEKRIIKGNTFNVGNTQNVFTASAAFSVLQGHVDKWADATDVTPVEYGDE